MNFAQLLKQEFATRKSRNKRYSIRSFAKRLEVDATALLRIMNGERAPTAQTIKKIISRLGYSSDKQTQLFDKLQLSKIKKSQLLENAFDQNIFEENFSSDHVLVLTSLRLKNYSLNSLREKICTFLEITNREFENILKDLHAVGAVELRDQHIKVVYKNKSTVPLPLTSKLRREIQKDFLLKAIHSIDTVPFEDRDNATLTIPVHTENLEEIKRILQLARRKINALSEKQRQPNTVYNISTALYPVIR